jgi:magnesium and cobalt exporter, CNNM family
VLAVEIVVLILLMLLNGVFALSEMAIVASRRARLAARGGLGVARALELMADPGRFLSTVQTGITLVGTFAGAFGGATIAAPVGDWLDTIPFIAPHGGRIAIIIVVVAITYVSLVVGELVPKRVALANPERIATLIAGPMAALSRIAAPVVWLLLRSSDLLLKLFRLDRPSATTVTEEEVRTLIAEGTRAGVFEPEERQMIDGVLRLADRRIRAIMTPRAEVAWIDLAASREDVVARLQGAAHTQLLVCDGSIDNAVGLIDARAVLGALARGGPVRLAELARKVPIIPERTSVLSLIELFRREGEHYAAIVDEYGATQGIVTAIDVLESIAGDLPQRGETEGPMVVRREDGAYLIDGMLPIDEFEDLLGRPGLRGDGDYETLAGFVIERLGHLPEVGERLVADDMTIEILAMDGRRLDRVLVTLPRADPGG